MNFALGNDSMQPCGAESLTQATFPMNGTLGLCPLSSAGPSGYAEACLPKSGNSKMDLSPTSQGNMRGKEVIVRDCGGSFGTLPVNSRPVNGCDLFGDAVSSPVVMHGLAAGRNTPVIVND